MFMEIFILDSVKIIKLLMYRVSWTQAHSKRLSEGCHIFATICFNYILRTLFLETGVGLNKVLRQHQDVLTSTLIFNNLQYLVLPCY